MSRRHPIYLAVTDDLKRSRLTVLLRLILAIPHLLWLMLWAVAVSVAVIVQWFYALIVGYPWRPLHAFTAHYLRYATHVSAYVALLADPYPGFLGRDPYPVDLIVDGPDWQARWKTLLRVILVIPAYVFTVLLAIVVQVVAFVGWFASLALGRMPRGLRDLGAYCLRYQQQTTGYLYLLTDAYPTLAAEPPRSPAAVTGLTRYERTQVVRSLAPFARLSLSEARAVAEIASDETFSAGDALVREGEPGSVFYVVVDGTTEVTRGGETVNRHSPGDFFGEIALIAHSPRTATVQAVTPLRALAIGDRRFRALLGRQPELQEKVIGALAGRVSR